MPSKNNNKYDLVNQKLRNKKKSLNGFDNIIEKPIIDHRKNYRQQLEKQNKEVERLRKLVSAFTEKTHVADLLGKEEYADYKEMFIAKAANDEYAFTTHHSEQITFLDLQLKQQKNINKELQNKLNDKDDVIQKLSFATKQNNTQNSINNFNDLIRKFSLVIKNQERINNTLINQADSLKNKFDLKNNETNNSFNTDLLYQLQGLIQENHQILSKQNNTQNSTDNFNDLIQKFSLVIKNQERINNTLINQADSLKNKFDLKNLETNNSFNTDLLYQLQGLIQENHQILSKIKINKKQSSAHKKLLTNLSAYIPGLKRFLLTAGIFIGIILTYRYLFF